MLVTADQLLAHAVGDYILQSDWMATRKTKEHIAAAAHALMYSSVFALFRPSLLAFAVILVSHFFIDRYRLARYVVWAKNWIAPKYMYSASASFRSRFLPFAMVSDTGYPPLMPAWLSVWLLIIADNILHVTINAIALRYL